MSLTKLQLDAMTDGAEAMLGGVQLDAMEADYAAKVAQYLATQFPDVPELRRIVVACAQYMSALAANEIHSAVLVHILAGAGLRIGATP